MHGPDPLQAEPTDVVAVHLVQGTVAPGLVVPPPHQPIGGIGITEHRVRDRAEVGDHTIHPPRRGTAGDMRNTRNLRSRVEPPADLTLGVVLALDLDVQRGRAERLELGGGEIHGPGDPAGGRGGDLQVMDSGPVQSPRGQSKAGRGRRGAHPFEAPFDRDPSPLHADLHDAGPGDRVDRPLGDGEGRKPPPERVLLARGLRVNRRGEHEERSHQEQGESGVAVPAAGGTCGRPPGSEAEVRALHGSLRVWVGDARVRLDELAGDPCGRAHLGVTLGSEAASGKDGVRPGGESARGPRPSGPCRAGMYPCMAAARRRRRRSGADRPPYSRPPESHWRHR